MKKIKTFQEFIKESIWSDIQDRSTGEIKRKEDDVNNMDMVGLYEYILSHYEPVTPNGDMTYGTSNMAIVAKGDVEILLTYNFGEVHFYFNLLRKKSLYDALRKQFYVIHEQTTHFRIMPKGDCTNQFFIDVLDCIVANTKNLLKKKDNVNESIWSDIQDRSTGEVVRKEDDFINHMDMKEFCDYIREHYKSSLQYWGDNDGIYYHIGEREDGIFVPVFSSYDNNSYLSMRYYSDGDQTLKLDIKGKKQKFLAELEKRFSIEIEKIKSGGQNVYIMPKDGDKLTNRFYLEVLDTILDLDPGYPILRRKQKKTLEL